MKRLHPLLILLGSSTIVAAATTIDPASPYVYGANIGWINAQADGTNGAVIGEFYCSGYLYSANCGWIFLGDGSPSGGQHYSNVTPGECGVNHDGEGNLYGYAYGANIGWIGFEQGYGKPRIDLLTGNLTGYAWGANVGWINLQGLRILVIDPGNDADADGIADAWEYRHVGFSKTALTILSATNDWDADGILDVNEYIADTDPMDSNDFFRITAFEVLAGTNRVSWPASPSRVYELQQADELSDGTGWDVSVSPFVPVSDGLVTVELDGVTNRIQVYRARVSRGPIPD